MRVIFLLVLLMGFALQPAISHAKPFDQPMLALVQEKKERKVRGRKEAIEHIERTTQGRVLRIDDIQNNGQKSWRMKVLLPDGRVRTITVDEEQ